MSVPEHGAAGLDAGRTFIILNPAAGQEDPVRLRRMIGGAFAARSAAFDMADTRRAGHATELARYAVDQGYRAVAVVGGDGTIAEVASGLIDTEVPMAIIPRGTANQLAHNLRLPSNLEEAVDVAVGGVPTPLDLGRIRGRAFALVAGAGYDAAVMASATRGLKERWGFGAYVLAALKEAMTAQPARFRIVADEREVEVEAVSVLLAVVGELFTAFLPFSLPLAPRPTESWRDGLFDVVVLAPRNLVEVAGVLWQASRRQFTGTERLVHFQARTVTIDADPPIAVQIDGDPAGTTPVSAIAVRNGVRVLSPRTS